MNWIPNLNIELGTILLYLIRDREPYLPDNIRRRDTILPLLRHNLIIPEKGEGNHVYLIRDREPFVIT